jgi:hypothetical protein
MSKEYEDYCEFHDLNEEVTFLRKEIFSMFIPEFSKIFSIKDMKKGREYFIAIPIRYRINQGKNYYQLAYECCKSAKEQRGK